MKTAELLVELRRARLVPLTHHVRVKDVLGRDTWEKREVKDAEGNTKMSPNFGAPSFNNTNEKGKVTRHGHILGTVGDWLDEMGAGREHLAPAIAKVRASPEYRHLISLGFEDTSSAADLKNGTLNLIGWYEPIIGSEQTRRLRVRRKVLANGNIRTYAGHDDHHAGRGATTHPHTAKTDPHSDPVDRIAKSMRASIERIAKIYQVEYKKFFLNSFKHD